MAWLKKLQRPVLSKRRWVHLRKYWPMYLMMLPGLLYLIIFRYGPIAGLSLAFQDYRVTRTIFSSPWAGLDNFQKLFNTPNFTQILKNTIIISLYKIIFSFPAPIILALMINDLENVRFKRTLQTAFYLPHFISWVVLGNIIMVLISPSSGAISKLYMQLTGASQLNIMMNKGVGFYSFNWFMKRYYFPRWNSTQTLDTGAAYAQYLVYPPLKATTPEYLSNGAILSDLESKYFAELICSTELHDFDAAFDKYITEWNDYGGRQWSLEMNQEYQTMLALQ